MTRQSPNEYPTEDISLSHVNACQMVGPQNDGIPDGTQALATYLQTYLTEIDLEEQSLVGERLLLEERLRMARSRRAEIANGLRIRTIRRHTGEPDETKAQALVEVDEHINELERDERHLQWREQSHHSAARHVSNLANLKALIDDDLWIETVQTPDDMMLEIPNPMLTTLGRFVSDLEHSHKRVEVAQMQLRQRQREERAVYKRVLQDLNALPAQISERLVPWLAIHCLAHLHPLRDEMMFNYTEQPIPKSRK